MKQFYTLLLASLFTSLGFGQSPGDLLITEFMADPLNVGDAAGEYFEVYNATGAPIDINGWTIEDDGSDSHVISGSVIVPANGFAILAISGDPAGDGSVTPNYIYSSFALANGADEIVLTAPSLTEIARVNYNDGNEYGAGTAIELENISIPVNGAYVISGSGVNAVAATDSLGSGGDFGSPGSAGNTLGISSGNDSDTEIATPTSGQVTAATIVAANSTTALNAVPVFRFNVEDQGSGDLLPTNVTRMRFVPGANNTANWTDHIQAITMTDVTNSIDLTPLTTVTINDLEIIVDYGPPLVILDNGTTEYELAIILNVDEILDGAIVQMEIPAIGSGFLADPSGSTFLEPQPGTITGPQMPINVIGTELEFNPQPAVLVDVDLAMPSVGVRAIDVNGNVDTDYNQNVDITSSGILDGSPVSETAVNGVATFNNLVHTALGVGLQLTADDGSLPSVNSSAFEVADLPDCIAVEDFDGGTPNWGNTTDVAFFDNGWGTDGYFGLIDISAALPITLADMSGNILGECDLDDEGDNGTTGFATTTFDPVDVSLYNDVVVSFDWEIVNYNGPSDDARYEVFFDGVGQGIEFLVNGGVDAANASGTVTIDVPNVISSIGLEIQIRNNGADGFSGFDNFKVTGVLPSENYPGNGATGFGGPLGTGSFDIDAFTNAIADFTFNRGGGAFNDFIVLYIDSEADGISSSASINDEGDDFRKAISGRNGGDKSTVIFPPGFNADFAVAMRFNEAALFSIDDFGNLGFIRTLYNDGSLTTTETSYSFTIDLVNELNTSPGFDSFKFLATYLNGGNAFRSDESIGENTASGNPGSTTDITFETYYQVASRKLGGVAPTQADGLWTNDGSWVNGNPPLDGDAVTISNTLSQDLSFTNNGTLTIDGTLDVLSGFSLITFSSIDGSGTLNISGSLSIREGGFTNIVPNYTSVFTTLEYKDIIGTYNRFNEWGTGTVVGAGVPGSVIIDNASVDLSNPSGTDTSDETFTAGNDFTMLNGSSLNIDPTKNLIVGGDLNNSGGTITMTSTSTRYPSLIVDGSAPGDVTYNRFVNSEDNGRDLIASPVNQTWSNFLGAGSNEANILDDGNTLPTTYLFGPFNNTSGLYENLTDASSVNLTPGVGYRAATNTAPIDGTGTTLEFTGTITTGDPSVDLFQSINSFWNLMGNPYTSYLDTDAFLVANITTSNNLRPLFGAVYGYNTDDSGGPNSIWTVWDLNPPANGLIAPGQGFFVAAPDGGGTTADFTAAMRTTGTDDDFIANRNVANSNNFAHAILNMNTVSESFVTNVFFRDFNTRGLDPGYDTGAFNQTANGVYSYLVEDNTGVALFNQSLPYADLTDIVVPIVVNLNPNEQITFSLNGDSVLPAGIDVFLDDVVDNTATLLNTGTYTLTPSTTLSGGGRFFLRFASNALSISQNDIDGLQIFSNVQDRTIVIAGELNAETTAVIFDMQGRMVKQVGLDANLLIQAIGTDGLSSGVYVVQISNGTQSKTEKVILR